MRSFEGHIIKLTFINKAKPADTTARIPEHLFICSFFLIPNPYLSLAMFFSCLLVSVITQHLQSFYAPQLITVKSKKVEVFQSFKELKESDVLKKILVSKN